MGRRSALGRGLDSLIPPTEVQPERPSEGSASGDATGAVPRGVLEVAVDDIRANPFQPRVDFDPE